QDYLSRFFSDVGVSAPDSQEFFGLEATGQLDSNTLEVMNRPRCGFTDVLRYSHFEGGPKWDKTVITYRVTEYTPDLTQSEVDETLAKALKLYGDVTPLDFKQIDSGTADIMIKFTPGDHGDFAPFDGPQGVLAHAFSPGEGHGGDTHFDEDESWTLTAEGSNLFLVAAHEFGHALGLAHSQVQTALMFPTYQYVNTDGYTLPSSDQPTAEPKPNPKPPRKPMVKPPRAPDPTSEPVPDRCDPQLTFDAVTKIQGICTSLKMGGTSFILLARLKIQSVWAGITKVDAAYEYKRDNTVFFFKVQNLVMSRYWGFRGNAALPGYPKRLSDLGFPSSVTGVDAAVHVSSASRTLFFVGYRFWRRVFNERRGKMDRGYPKLIHRELRGIGYKVDAAFENRGFLYFSYGSSQTEYHYTRRRASRKLFNYRWMDC
uniref:Matrix metallopeptidase 30 n=1 Tax=Salarias fasciatus TaxID=181472 RepID=A0A672HCV5_SALFA